MYPKENKLANTNEHVALVHEGKKAFNCKKCDYGCSKKEYMQQHVALVHEGTKPLKCKRC